MRIMIRFIELLIPIFFLNCTQHPNTTELLKSYIQAANMHDISVLRAKLDENIVFILGHDTLIGKYAVIAPHEFDAGAGTRLTIKSLIVKGDTIESIIEETNNYMDTLCMPSVINYARFIFHNGLLTRIEPTRSQFALPATDSIDKCWNQWIQTTHPEAWAQIIKPNGNINFSRETGELLVKLACEWRQSLEK